MNLNALLTSNLDRPETNTTVEITLEFEGRPTKADVYTLLTTLIAADELRYDLDNELDAQDENNKR